MSEIDELINEYVNHFKENFPVFVMPTDIDIEDIIKECLNKNIRATDLYPYDKDLEY